MELRAPTFLFPQCGNVICIAEKQALGKVSQELLDTQVNPAVWESGHMVLKRKKDYEDASEDYAWKLLAVVSLSEERFEEVKAYLLEAVDGFILAEEPKKGHTAKDLDDVIATATPAEKEVLFQVHGTHAHVHEGGRTTMGADGCWGVMGMYVEAVGEMEFVLVAPKLKTLLKHRVYKGDSDVCEFDSKLQLYT
ncbi:GDP-L-galactose phosphorylase 2 [Nymphaea thermarum]|nr:GDP-L-galactose phosphorylase 2 [Nymphaea thermarum]